MNRGKPLARRTPLARGKGLTRKAMDRHEAEERARVRGEVYARDRFACVLAGVPEALEALGPCWGRITPHHLRKASQLGPYTAENLVTLCVFHNGAVEDHPRAAYLLGLVERSTPLRPEA